jgi:predicted metal-dependent peptidase
MDAGKRISQARIALMLDYPFYGHLALSLEPVENNNLEHHTMATDGRHLFYDKGFVDKLSLGEVMGVIAHEVIHCALLHIPRESGRQHTRWNYATDFATNELITLEPQQKARVPISLPDGCLVPGGTLDPKGKFKGLYAEAIYELLPEEPPANEVWVTIDSHDKWKDWGNGDQNGQNNQDGDGEEDGPALDQQWREKVAQAATVARMAGKFPSQWELLVGELLQPKLDWKTILRDMITSAAKSDFRMSPPNKKHLWRGFYMPSLMGEEINIAVYLDTSGSIGDDEIVEFLSEVKGICDTYDDYTIYLRGVDTKIHDKWTIRPFDPMPQVITGRGGTDFNEPMQEALTLPGITAIVYMTDGYPNASWPDEPPIPVIWVINTDVVPPWGSHIVFPKEVKA